VFVPYRDPVRTWPAHCCANATWRVRADAPEARLLDERFVVDTYGSHRTVLPKARMSSHAGRSSVEPPYSGGEDASQNAYRRAERKHSKSCGRANVLTEHGIGWTSGLSLTNPGDSVY